MHTTPRGLPIPDGTDPDNVPYWIGALADYLDPQPNATGERIVFIVEGNGDPNANAVPINTGSIYLDRNTGRVWVPLITQYGNSTGLFWFMLGAENDQALESLQNQTASMVTSGTSSGVQVRWGQAAATAGGTTGIEVPAFHQYFPFDTAFPNSCLMVVATHAAAVYGQGTVSIGVEQSSRAGFQVLFQRPDTTKGFLGGTDTVTINYIALGY